MDPLARVLADPGSIAARKELLAAWTAAGNPRAELLEFQLELRERRQAGDHSSERTTYLSGRVGPIARKHGRAWAGELADLVTSYTFHRGLVGEVTLSGEKFLSIGARLFELAPIQHVNLAAPLGDIAAIAASPLLRKLVSLDVSGHGAAVGDRGAIAIAKSPHVANLRWLALESDEIGVAGAEALAASPYLDRVRFLSLDRNPADTTPTVVSGEGSYDWMRPALADRLEGTYGKRPWLTVDNPENYPPNRDELAITA